MRSALPGSVSLLVFATSALAICALTPQRAEACGGCFISQSENTQVTGHRMAMSISPEQTTLYDQITYTGAPEEFAWILPIRGQVQIGLSSDALFETLESMSQVSINSPIISCPSPTPCDGAVGPGPAGNSASSGLPVEVIAAEVVGPYETVQLSSSDPAALLDWLTSKGFVVPAEIEPVIDDYVTEGFDFLALRLVPGEGIDSMRPVRITTPGASPELPLRMVAAGTGAKTVMSLWVIGEGRYEPQNFPSFTVEESQLTWNWSTQKSDYGEIRAQAFADSNGFAWHASAAEQAGAYSFDNLLWLAQNDPQLSGYGDADGEGALTEAEADVAVLLTGIATDSLWVSRLDAELSRPALATDLLLEASIPQATIDRFLDVENTVGTEPECPPSPPPPDCGEGGSGGWWDVGSSSSSGGSASRGGSSDGCSSSAGASVSSRFGLAVLVGLGLAALRRRRRL